jgi:excisionase family DNA binding protein
MGGKPARARLTLAARTEEGFLNVQEAADYLGVGKDAVYDACQTKGLKHFKMGRSSLRIKRSWIDQWVARRAHGQE